MNLLLPVSVVLCCVAYKMGAHASARELEIEQRGPNGNEQDKSYILTMLEDIAENDFDDSEIFVIQRAKSKLRRNKRKLIDLIREGRGRPRED